MSRLIYSADAWRILNGLVSVYKPAGMSPKLTCRILQHAIVNDLNQMTRRVEPGYLIDSNQENFDFKKRLRTISQSRLIENNLQIPKIKSLSEPAPEPEYYQEEYVTTGVHYGMAERSGLLEDIDQDWEVTSPEGKEEDLPVDYSSHPKVLGPGYSVEDVLLQPVQYLSTRSSGVFVVGINRGVKMARQIRRNSPLVTLEVSCELGKATATGFSDSKTIAKATWKHLSSRRWAMDQILSNIQASHQKMAWKATNVDPASQEAYELAVKGPVKPDLLTDTIVYGIRCTEWTPPGFRLSIQCIGESQQFILDLVSEIGIRLKTHAHCTGIRCAQLGIFCADQTILPQQLSLESVLANIGTNKRTIRTNNPFRRQKSFKYLSSGQTEGTPESSKSPRESMISHDPVEESREIPETNAEISNKIVYGRFKV